MHGRKDLIKYLLMVAEICGKDLSETRAEFYLEALEEFGYDQAIRGLKTIAQTLSDGKPYPSITDIKNAAQGRVGAFSAQRLAETDDDNLAREAADRIIATMQSIGSLKDTERVKAKLGELAWQVVVSCGGWQAVCDSITHNDQIPTMRAQWRGSASYLLAKNRKGIPFDEAPKFPKYEDSPVLAAIDVANRAVIDVGPSREKPRE